MRKRYRRAFAVLAMAATALVGLTAVPASAFTNDPTNNPCMSNSSFSMSISRSTLVWQQTATLTVGMNVAAGCTVLPSLVFTDDTSGVSFSEPLTFGSSTVQPPSTGSYHLHVISNGNTYDVAYSNVDVTFPVLYGHPWARITRSGDQAATFADAISQPKADVYVQGDVNLDLSHMSYLPIGAGTQIIGERDVVHPDGPRLFTTTDPPRLFIIGDDRTNPPTTLVNNIRITGIRLDGMEDPDPCANAGLPNDAIAIWILGSQGIEIDNDEIFHWRGSGIDIHDTSADLVNQANLGVRVLNDYIHDNQHPTYCGADPFGKGHGAGYGVVVSDGGFATITGNTFSDNRHSVAGHGSTGDGYLLLGNLFFNPGIDSEKDLVTNLNHQIDMHGLDTCGNGLPGAEDYDCGQAGTYMEVADNVVVSDDAAAIQLRGVPLSYDPATQTGGMQVHDNMFAGSEGSALTQTRTGLVEGPGNVFDASTQTESFRAPGLGPTCDFDGDGIQDGFRSAAGSWWYHSSLENRWVYMRQAPAGVTSPTLADINGDGLCDVTGPEGTEYLNNGLFPTFSLMGPVPNVVGSSQADAADAIAAAGMALDTVTPVISDAPVGSVVSQSIVAGSARQAGSLVAITVAAPHVMVPPVTGSAETTAVHGITQANLALGPESRVVNSDAAGTVIGQSPPAGAIVLPGTAVSLTVSLGPAVPAVLGLDQISATRVLDNAGYTVAPSSANDCVSPGDVDLQSPQAGTLEPAGTTVNIQVSTCTKSGGGSGIPK